MERAVLVYTTYPSLVEAEKAGRDAVAQRLAACINILPGMVSHYWWEGKIERGEEVVMILKTRASLADRHLPGEGGAVDNAVVLTALGKLGYDGPVTPAADKSRLAGRGRDQIVKAAAAAFDQAWNAAGLSPAGRLAAVSGS